MNNEIIKPVMFVSGVIFGVGLMFFSARADFIDQNKTIAKLEAEVKTKPVITVDALGICRVKHGGKAYMLVDITEELQGGTFTLDSAENNPYRANEQEVEKGKIK